MMRIVADENIPCVKQAFAPLGEVVCLPGRQMTTEALGSADVLLVRSITQVGAKLLDGSAVRFVGTATIGTDHIDLPYLRDRGIAFSSAAGSNSNSVAEYVITALLVLAQNHNWDLNGKTLGIIGVGNIGSRVEQKAQTLGMRVLCNDPPLQRRSGNARYLPLDEVLRADFVTCHVPLTRAGPDATHHLIDGAKLGQLKSDAVLLNTSRGAVVDNQALQVHLTAQRLGAVVLDVWEHEPEITLPLLEQVTIGTPHIAGYSLDGKVNGTVMLHRALCATLGRSEMLSVKDLLSEPAADEIALDGAAGTDQQLLARAMTRIYDIMRDDQALREVTTLPPGQRGDYFDNLRKNYPCRREAPFKPVRLRGSRPCLIARLTELGFRMV